MKTMWRPTLSRGATEGAYSAPHTSSWLATRVPKNTTPALCHPCLELRPSGPHILRS